MAIGTPALPPSGGSVPVGAATSANQVLEIASLSSIDGKIPALGQALAASSVPVVLTAAQLITLTPLATVAVTQSTSPWVISGSISFTAPQHIIADSGTITTVTTVSAARIVGNGGAVLDAVNTAATAPANGVLTLGIYNSTEPSPTTGQSVGIQLDSKGRQRMVIMDAAANTRGANVDANSNLGVVLAAETTKVLGVTRTADGAGNLLTTNSTTYTAKFAVDNNLLGTLGTAFTTAGFVDIKGADGNVFVRNATSANFLANVTLQTQTDTVMVGGVNVKEINGVAPSMGVGATGTGVLRTVIANDAGRTLVSKGGSASSSGDNTLVVAGTNRLKVFAFSLSTVSTTAVTAIFQSGASGTELWRVILQTPASVAGGANLVVQPPAWLFATASATLLNLNLSAAVAVNWSCSYFDEA